MADQLDVEAMLEAPLQEKKNGISSKDGHSSFKSERRHRDHDSQRSRHSHSPSKRRRSSRDRERYTDRERDQRRNSRRSPRRDRNFYTRSRSRSKDRHSRKSTASDRRPPPARSPSPEVDEMTRDQRTVFASQLAQRLRHKELFEFFSQAGRVKDARIVTDKNTRRSKGVGYIEFYKEESVEKAIMLTGQKLLGIPVIVQRSEAEKNRIAEQNAVYSKVPDISYNRLYVGSVHFNLTEEDLRLVFEPFGELEFANVQKDPETGRSKGYGFIQFKRAADAKQALDKMNGFELAGRTIKVGLVTDKGTSMSNTLALDDNEDAGVAMTSQSRVELMQKLARDPTPYQNLVEAPLRRTVPFMTTRAVLLTNMFGLSEETEPNWDTDLQDDVREECSRFGQVVHIKVEKDSEGEVYVKFSTPYAAEEAIKSLHGRWFAAKQISAVPISEVIYNTRFPKAAAL